MAHYDGIVTTEWPAEAAFDYLADFRNVVEWDPGISGARLVAGEPGEVGATFELDLQVLGRSRPLRYRTLVAERPRRLVLCADTPALRSTDSISLDSTPSGSEVTWDAHLQLKGFRKLAAPVAGLALARDGQRARQGLEDRLSAPA